MAHSDIQHIIGSKEICAPALTYGRDNEHRAVQKYASSHPNLVVEHADFFVDINYPFLGASPDRLLKCENGDVGLLEVKCPYKYRSLTLEKALQDNFLSRANGARSQAEKNT